MKKTIMLMLFTSALTITVHGARADQEIDSTSRPPLKVAPDSASKSEAEAEAQAPAQLSAQLSAQLPASDKNKCQLKGSVTFSEKPIDTELQSSGEWKKGEASSQSEIPPGWVLIGKRVPIGENSRGDVRYGPDIRLGTSARPKSSESVETPKSELTDPKIDKLPPTRLDPFILMGGPDLIYGDHGTTSPPPLQDGW